MRFFHLLTLSLLCLIKPAFASDTKYCYKVTSKVGQVSNTETGGYVTTGKIISVDVDGAVERIVEESLIQGVGQKFQHSYVVDHDAKTAFNEVFDPNFKVTIITPLPYWIFGETCMKTGQTISFTSTMIVPIPGAPETRLFQSRTLHSVETKSGGVMPVALHFEDVVHASTAGLRSSPPFVTQTKTVNETGVSIWNADQ